MLPQVSTIKFDFAKDCKIVQNCGKPLYLGGIQIVRTQPGGEGGFSNCVRLSTGGEGGFEP